MRFSSVSMVSPNADAMGAAVSWARCNGEATTCVTSCPASTFATVRAWA